MTDNAPSHPPSDDSDSRRPDRPPASDQPSASKDGGDRLFNPKVLRLMGLGTELAGFTLVTMGLGYLVDAARGHQTRYVTALGALLGFTLGMIRFIRNVTSLDDK